MSSTRKSARACARPPRTLSLHATPELGRCRNNSRDEDSKIYHEAIEAGMPQETNTADLKKSDEVSVETPAPPPQPRYNNTLEALSSDLIMAEIFPFLSCAEKVHVATATRTLYTELDSFALYLNDHEWALNEAGIVRHFGKSGLRYLGNQWRAAGLVLYTEASSLSSFVPLLDFRFVLELSIHDSWALNDLQVLATASRLQVLKLSYPAYSDQVTSITSLDGLVQCKHLRELSICNATQLTDISALQDFGGELEEFNIVNCPIETLAGIGACTSLIALSIHSTELRSLGDIAAVTTLETVAIHGSRYLRDLAPLGELGSHNMLRSVLLSKCGALHDLCPLESFGLECVLEFHHCNGLSRAVKALNRARQRRHGRRSSTDSDGN
jgi:hypothetical protein